MLAVAYLYGGLGVVMMVGVMAIFEFGLSISGLEGQLLPPIDAYFQNANKSARKVDRDFLQLLNNTKFLETLGREKSAFVLCDCLKCEIKGDGSAKDPGLCDDDILNSPHCGESHKQISTEYSFLNDYVVDETAMNPSHTKYSVSFPSACFLTSPKQHRAVVLPDSLKTESSYLFYSCTGSQCSFEHLQGDKP